MKTLKSIVLGLALLVVGTIANAANKPAAVLTKNDVLNIYVNAVVHGKLDGLDAVLDDNVKFVMQRGDNETILNKKNILESFKASENMEQGCTYTTTVVKDTKDGMIVKLEMKYDGYVRTNLITISSRRADFKITKVENQA
ncbi:hypothetical protein [Mucilaginibacter sp. UYCu711]|uniref:hypothetical protein n=1 Tax=Mucilaginibacter sp. UYCu711 TaxID=3156339 RepID=UPI003D1E42FF